MSRRLKLLVARDLNPYADEFLVSLCHACHAKQTRLEQQGGREGSGRDRAGAQSPVDSPQKKPEESICTMGRGKHLNGKITGEEEVLSRKETLRILSEMTRAGSVSAAIALERALRLDSGEEEEEDDIWAELDAFRPTRRPRPS